LRQFLEFGSRKLNTVAAQISPGRATSLSPGSVDRIILMPIYPYVKERKLKAH
jgi:hypothetical protein